MEWGFVFERMIPTPHWAVMNDGSFCCVHIRYGTGNAGGLDVGFGFGGFDIGSKVSSFFARFVPLRLPLRIGEQGLGSASMPTSSRVIDDRHPA